MRAQPSCFVTVTQCSLRRLRGGTAQLEKIHVSAFDHPGTDASIILRTPSLPESRQARQCGAARVRFAVCECLRGDLGQRPVHTALQGPVALSADGLGVCVVASGVPGEVCMSTIVTGGVARILIVWYGVVWCGSGHINAILHTTSRLGDLSRTLTRRGIVLNQYNTDL